LALTTPENTDVNDLRWQLESLITSWRDGKIDEAELIGGRQLKVRLQRDGVELVPPDAGDRDGLSGFSQHRRRGPRGLERFQLAPPVPACCLDECSIITSLRMAEKGFNDCERRLALASPGCPAVASI
jgi:hypothetical protein